MNESKFARDFPSNSDKSKRNQAQKNNMPKCKPIAHCVKTKKSFLSNFLSNSIKDVGGSLINDILIPAAKTTLYEIITGGASMSLFGERRVGSRNSYVSGNRSQTNYKNCSNPSYRREISQSSRIMHDFDSIGFNTRPEAEEVLSVLVDQTIEFGAATVANFYDLSGIESNYTDQNYGWTNLRSAYTERCRDKYIIVFPQVKPLD